MNDPTKVRLADLNPSPYNPRTITAEEMGQLKASIRAHGMVTSVVVQKKGMIIIGGHQRVEALTEMTAAGEDVPNEVWAIVLDVDDDEARRLNVALNMIGGSFDEDLLAQVFVEIGDVDDVLAQAMGFGVEEVDALIAAYSIDPVEEAERLEAEAEALASFDRSITLTIEFAGAEQRDEARDLLKKIASELGKRPGDVALAALKALKPRAAPGRRKAS